jgi:hypothetical protein
VGKSSLSPPATRPGQDVPGLRDRSSFARRGLGPGHDRKANTDPDLLWRPTGRGPTARTVSLEVETSYRRRGVSNGGWSDGIPRRAVSAGTIGTPAAPATDHRCDRSHGSEQRGHADGLGAELRRLVSGQRGDEAIAGPIPKNPVAGFKLPRNPSLRSRRLSRRNEMSHIRRR